MEFKKKKKKIRKFCAQRCWLYRRVKIFKVSFTKFKFSKNPKILVNSLKSTSKLKLEKFPKIKKSAKVAK